MHQFPKNFLWGASTASHQVEGNTHNQWTVWEQANAARLAATAEQRLGRLPNYSKISQQAHDPNNYISGIGVDHYNRYKEDFDIIKQLNLNAFRFGIEWSRIEPKPNEWNLEAIEHYRSYIQELKKRGIEPVLTLWHWTMPLWFADIGGFTKASNCKYFERYVAKIAELFAQDLHYIVTLNEPNVYTGFSYLTGEWPPSQKNPYRAWKVYRNLAATHKRAYHILHSANPSVKVGVVLQLADMQPAQPGNPLNKLVVKIRRYAWNWWFSDTIKKHQDFIGLNYYFTEYVTTTGRLKNPSKPVSDVGWYMEPRQINRLLHDVHHRYHLPILVLENGIADSEDKQRTWWLEQTLIGLQDAIQQGVPIIGYLHWSLLDNFEWAYGWWPQFGLVSVDRTTMKRTVRPSAQWLSTYIARAKQSDEPAYSRQSPNSSQ